jgi:hypothetical protein
MTVPVVKTWPPFQGAQMLSVGRAASPPMKKLAALRGKPWADWEAGAGARVIFDQTRKLYQRFIREV